MDLASIEEAVSLAENRWPNTQWKIKAVSTHDEACSPCPFCGGDDRFVLWINGYWMCRPGAGHCGQQGWIDDDKSFVPTPEERRTRRIEAEQNRARVERETLRRTLTALQQMAHCTDHIEYHKCLDEGDRNWWHAQGVNNASISDYELGVCYGCPTDREHRPSYTIPVYDSSGKRLVNIRHRLIDAPNGDKYRPHCAGLGRALFNARLVKEEPDIVMTEGAKKAIVCGQQGFPTVGIFGKSGFDMRWLKHFESVNRLWIALDPDAYDGAYRLGKEIASESGIKEVRVCSFPTKPDDYFLHGGDAAGFLRTLELGRRM